MEDEDGMVGVALTKDLVRVAGAGLRQHISTLAPYVLPVSELLCICRPPSGTSGAAGRSGFHGRQVMSCWR
jgi:hypothetical protein